MKPIALGHKPSCADGIDPMQVRPAARTLLASLRPATVPSRLYHQGPILLEKALPPRRKITEDEITESFLKGSGPGGQKINKTSSAVQLKHLPTGIVVKCQETRSREQNRKFARQILGERLDEIEKGGESRAAIKAERAKSKKASADKKTRRKYKKLAEGKEAVVDNAGFVDAAANKTMQSETIEKPVATGIEVPQP
ncbi:hypothetical protein B0A48_17900 [Cryoendolithus antarcticus]|uniref:Prokaryotic-type class I peptide chain release factors domain-containing protein n=1 Tax=Cryoendolithus antarcticus TaxID=1507870 RepID=A0A1V8SAC6_9PEZI|nr:hypothetical protein B0A48_17900 [Cryoendolithus antarcticus]